MTYVKPSMILSIDHLLIVTTKLRYYHRVTWNQEISVIFNFQILMSCMRHDLCRTM